MKVDFGKEAIAHTLAETLLAHPVVCLHGADALALTALAVTSVLDVAVRGRKTVYIACEGEWQVSATLARLGKARQLGQVKGLFVLSQSVDLLKARNVDNLAQMIARKVGRPDLLVLDCLAYCFGADELNPAAMDAFVAHLHRLQELTGARVLLLHRTGAAGVRGSRSTAEPPARLARIDLAGGASLAAAPPSAADDTMEPVPIGGTPVRRTRAHEHDKDTRVWTQ
ncbi:MAG TPA: AAA family ATPase [Chloroflexia bacterium]|nr:AAA family ATPase [Chloroflexia bacterium]